jgi:hypothetical protein
MAIANKPIADFPVGRIIGRAKFLIAEIGAM